MAKVSVIIPTYNCAQYISEAIDSVLQQTYQDFEILIIDDGSHDTTREIVKRYAAKHSNKIRYFFQENKGPAAARNKGLRESGANYIALLDADDLWLPNRLKEGVSILDQMPDVGLVHSATIRIDENGKFLEKPKRNSRFLSGSIAKFLLTRKAHISSPTVLFKKECIEKAGYFDENPQCIGVEDRDLWIRIAKAYKIFYIPQALAYYRIHKRSLSNNSEKALQGKYYVINKYCADNEYSGLRKVSLARIHKESGDEFLNNRRLVESKEHYLKSIALWPFDPWPWLNLLKAVTKLGLAKKQKNVYSV